MRKYEYLISINGGTKTGEAIEYSFGATRGICLYLNQGKGAIAFRQGVKKQACRIGSPKEFLTADAIKKLLLVHVVRYGKPLSIKKVELVTDGISENVYHEADAPFIYSMLDEKSERRLPESWRTREVSKVLVNKTKSSYDGRYNALTAMLIAYSKPFISERSMYLWMAMNGLYNYLSDCCKQLPECHLPFRNENKQHKLLCAVENLGKLPNVEDKEREHLYRDTISYLKHTEYSACEIQNGIDRGEQEICDSIRGILHNDQRDVDMDPKVLLTVWLPYQIRCRFFHSNQAMPMFMFADEEMLKALAYSNQFVSAFLEKSLLYWFLSDGTEGEGRRRIQEGFLRMGQ